MDNNFSCDLSAFFADFSDPAVLAGREIKVIFDRPYAQTEEDGFVVANRKPMLTAKSSDFVDARAGDSVTVAGENFEILSIQNNGTGLSEVYLKGGV